MSLSDFFVSLCLCCEYCGYGHRRLIRIEYFRSSQVRQVMQKNVRDCRREVMQAEMEEQRWTRVQ